MKRWWYHPTLFNFGRNNRLGLTPVCDDDDFNLQIGWLLSGRVLGFYVSHLFLFKKPRPFHYE